MLYLFGLIWAFLIAPAGIVLVIFGMIRNEWVERKRVELIHCDYSAYLKLVSYDTMMWKFWVWDVYKFVGEDDVI